MGDDTPLYLVTFGMGDDTPLYLENTQAKRLLHGVMHSLACKIHSGKETSSWGDAFVFAQAQCLPAE